MSPTKIHPSTNGTYTTDTTTYTNGHTTSTDSLLEQTIDSIARSIDYVIPPQTRGRLWDSVRSVGRERPLFLSLLATFTLFSLIPLLLFLTFTISTLLFTITTALLITGFWVGFAVLILVPTLLVTGACALAVWAWVVGGLFVCKWGLDAVEGVRSGAHGGKSER